MICQKCKAQLEDNALFCVECGTPVQQSTSQQTVQYQETKYQKIPQQAPPTPVYGQAGAVNFHAIKQKRRSVDVMVKDASLFALFIGIAGTAFSLWAGGWSGVILEEFFSVSKDFAEFFPLLSMSIVAPIFIAISWTVAFSISVHVKKLEMISEIEKDVKKLVAEKNNI